MTNVTKLLVGALAAAVALAVNNIKACDAPASVYSAKDSVVTVKDTVKAPVATASADAATTPASASDDGAMARYGDLRRTAVQDGSRLAATRTRLIPLERTAYLTLYNPDTKLPVWVAWHLTAERVSGKYKRDGIDFTDDMDVPAPRATDRDYVGCGYDRGHMCPSGDNKWSAEVQRESFLMTNVCPQLHSLNAGDWRELEEQCRDWAEDYGELYIVCGPVLMNKRHKTVGKNKVTVPEAFFKVIMRPGDEPKAIGFICRNEKGNKSMSSYVNTVDDVERITGLDFFAALPDDVEAAVESAASLDDWAD